MPERAEIAKAAAAGLREFAPSREACPALLGFDGFVDAIIAVVDQRQDAENYDPIATIKGFGDKIVAADGQSSNFELVVKMQKLGGNGPIMANTLAKGGIPITYVGGLGDPELNPVFTDFAKIADVHSIAEPGYTDALEFSNGKLMLGKNQALSDVTAERITERLGDRFQEMVLSAKLIGMVNWTMLTRVESVWELVLDILAKADRPASEQPFIFVDFADPEKRTREDLAGAVAWCRKLDQHAKVVLGMNLKEAGQVAEVLGLSTDKSDELALAEDIRAELGIYGVVTHPRHAAAAALRTESGADSARFHGPFVQNPKISTGAGDNFNGGFCLGLLAGLSVDQCLCAGTGTSGFYVRNAYSPGLEELADFCDDLPAPQG